MKIDPEKWYSFGEVVKTGALGKSPHTVSKRILEDKLEGNVLQVQSEGKSFSARYAILGKNLAEYLCKVTQ